MVRDGARTAAARSTPPSPVVEVRGLEKRFGGRAVLQALDWQVPPGRVLGLLGRNGAGKTTLLRCLLGLMPVDAGEIEIFGESMAEPGGERMHRIGFVPQTFDLFPWMAVRGFLDFTAAFYNHWDTAFAERLLRDWEIDSRAKIGALSQGQRQKLAIVRAMAPRPDLLVLDEPVASLDPQTRWAFMDELMPVVQAHGKTVIFSTHITADLERAEADIALLKDGRIGWQASQSALRARVRRAVLTRAGGWSALPALDGTLHGRIVDATRAELVVDGVVDDALHALAAGEGAELAIEPMSLEDLFVALA